MSSRPPRLFHMMSLAQHRLLKSTDAAFGDSLGITTAQLGVLFILERNPGAPPTPDDLRRTSPATSIRSISAVIADLLVRGASLTFDDGRAVHLFATPEALAKTAAARPILARLNARLMEGFSQREIATINRFLQSILERF